MSVRINVILPDETVRVLDRVAPKGNRSRVISDAVMHYVSSRGRSNLAEQLKAGALANAKRDMAIAEEWFPLEEEAWQKHHKPKPKAKK
jgi:CopG family transcriptional regulator/antitoxin EndoAI